MNKLFIDTNVLYEVLGYTRNEKVNHNELISLINSSEIIYLSSAVIAEILVRYRNNDEKLIDVLSVIGDNRFKKTQSKYMVFPYELDMFNLTDKNVIRANLDHFKKQIDVIMSVKATVEMEFMNMFIAMIEITIATILIWIFETEEERKCRLLRFYKEFILIQKDVLFDNTEKNMLYEAYKKNQEHDFCKSIFDYRLNYLFDNWVSLLEEANPCFFSNIDAKMAKKLNKKIEVNKVQPSLMIQWLESRIPDSQQCLIREEIRELLSMNLYDHNISPIYVEYFIMLYDRICQNGNKFLKNDICDMLILMSLDVPDAEILLFDENSYKFLKSIKSSSVSFIDKYYSK